MASTGPGISLEQPYVFTVLGIQFWDQALDQPVTDGLMVTAQLQNTSYPVVSAFRTASGTYAFQGLPCLHSVEYPASTSAIPASPSRTFTFVITVADALRRFLPALFAVDLPLGYSGVFLSNQTGSPPGQGGRAYLFSAPTRATAPGLSVVRVDLWDRNNDKPAAYAGVRILINGHQWTGISDELGRAQIQFPSPLLQTLDLGSPPGIGQGAPSTVSWPIQARVFYEPTQLRFPLQGLPDVPWPWSSTPSLKSILDAQQPALIWQNESGPPVSEWTGDISYGTPLILRTNLNDPTAISSVLMVSQITSP